MAILSKEELRAIAQGAPASLVQGARYRRRSGPRPNIKLLAEATDEEVREALSEDRHGALHAATRRLEHWTSTGVHVTTAGRR